MWLRSDRWSLAAALMVSAAAIVVVVVSMSSGGTTAASPVRSVSVDTQRGPERMAPPVPSPRAGAAMAYNPVRGEVVLFGGVGDGDPGPPLHDTWVLQGRRWSERHPATSPGTLDSARMVFDYRSHTCVLVSSGRGGVPAATWSWDGTTWTRLSDVPFEARETVAALASDPTSGHPLLLSVVLPADGPPSSATHTWTWDGRVWTLRHPSRPFPTIPMDGSAPILASIGMGAPGRLGRGVLAVFENGDGLARTLVWNGSTWTQVAVSGTPPYNPLGATMAGDVASDQVVLVGLGDNAGDPGSTWLWDGVAWHQGGPAPLIDSLYGGSTALSDSGSAHAIVIGESSPSGRTDRFDVVWTFDGQGWAGDRPA